ncbi:MAG: hypothetical protein LBH09_00910 [Peptococcaceae bacterium]|jgi:hypothetical protein|nr:hypothetical protein [Peptococcaceae bacterium]
MKRYKAIAILLLCLLLLSSCGTQAQQGGADPPVAAPTQDTPKPDDSDTTARPKRDRPAAPGSPVDPLAAGSPQRIEYEDGLISLTIKDGKAELSFDDDLWEERYGLYGIASPEFYSDDLILPGPFPVIFYDGEMPAVRDACIAQIAALDLLQTTTTIIPSVVLLLEDGSVCMTLADPYTQGDDTEFYCWRLPWLEDIVSLSSRADSDGNMTVYAADSRRMQYDIRIPAEFTYLFDRTLYCEIPLFDEYDDGGDYMTFEFTEDKRVTFEKYFSHGELYEEYYGTYDIQLAENPRRGSAPTGAITFDLSLGWWIWELDPEENTEEDVAFWEMGMKLDGVYAARRQIAQSWYTQGVPMLSLSYIGGNGLLIYRDDRAPDREFHLYTFYDYSYLHNGDWDFGWDDEWDDDWDWDYDYDGYSMQPWPEDSEGYFWFLGNEDDAESIALAEYVLENVPGLRETLMEFGLYLWPDGSVTNYSDGDVGQNVMLVERNPWSDAGVSFWDTYAVIDDGSIYRYDEDDDMWYLAG